MIAYHVDRAGKLYKGQRIELIHYPDAESSFSFMSNKLFNNQISKHGHFYLGDSVLNRAPDTISSIIEYETELVRRAFFPEMPSRFQSFFGVKTLDDLLAWGQSLNLSTSRIFQIEFGSSDYQEFDAAYLPNGFTDMNGLQYSPSLNFQKSFDYWSQKHSEHPQLEILVSPPVMIREEIHLSIVR